MVQRAHVSVVELPPPGGAEDARWAALAREAAEPNPFYEPTAVRAAASHLPGPRPLLLVVADGDRWLACLPVVRRPGRLESWRYLHRFLGTPLVHRDHVTEAVSGLVRGPGPAGVLLLHLLAADGPVRRALVGYRPITVGGHRRAVVCRRAVEDYLSSTLSASRYRELRRQSRLLVERFGAVGLVDQAGRPGAVDAFLTLEGSGWKGRQGTALVTAGHGPFFRAVCRGFAQEGRLELLALRAGDRTLAMGCNLIAGEGLFEFKIAYDEAYRRYSPGVQLEARLPARLHTSAHARWVDSCADAGNQMINRLWPDRRRLEHLLVPSPTPAGRLARLALQPAARWRTRSRS